MIKVWQVHGRMQIMFILEILFIAYCELPSCGYIDVLSSIFQSSCPRNSCWRTYELAAFKVLIERLVSLSAFGSLAVLETREAV